MDRTEKAQEVEALRSALNRASLVVLVHQSGLTVAESQQFRKEMRSKNARYKVSKNTLVRLAVKGTPYEPLVDYLKGPTALTYSEDPVSAAKITTEFSKKSGKLNVICGMMGTSFLDKMAVDQLATLPSLDELRGKLVGLFQAPATKMARLLQEPGRQLACVFAAHAQNEK